MNTAQCQHDLKHPVRVGRCHYACRMCGQDISFLLFLIEEAEEKDGCRSEIYDHNN